MEASSNSRSRRLPTAAVGAAAASPWIPWVPGSECCCAAEEASCEAEVVVVLVSLALRSYMEGDNWSKHGKHLSSIIQTKSRIHGSFTILHDLFRFAANQNLENLEFVKRNPKI